MKHKIIIEFDDEKYAISAGLRQNWLDGESKTQRVNLSCGAGLGTPYIVFSVEDKKSGKIIYAIADVRPVLEKISASLQTKLESAIRGGKAVKP